MDYRFRTDYAFWTLGETSTVHVQKVLTYINTQDTRDSFPTVLRRPIHLLDIPTTSSTSGVLAELHALAHPEDLQDLTVRLRLYRTNRPQFCLQLNIVNGFDNCTAEGRC